MKLTKKAFALSLIAAATLITACNEKENTVATKDNAATQSQQTENAKMLAAFNQSIRIVPVARNEASNGEQQGTEFTYQINNVSDKAIKSIAWVSAYGYQKNILYIHPFSFNFEQTLAPKGQFNFNFIIPFESLPQDSRAVFTNPNNEIEHITIAREIEFVDGSKITVED